MAASLAPECNQVKEKYDSCFLKWYSEKFLRGKATVDNASECAAQFQAYQECLQPALRSRGLDTMLEEARHDNKENDVLQMRRRPDDSNSS